MTIPQTTNECNSQVIDYKSRGYRNGWELMFWAVDLYVGDAGEDVKLNAH